MNKRDPILDRLAIWTLDDVAHYLQVSRRQVDYVRKIEDFPAEIRIGKGFPRFKAGEIMDWTEAQQVTAT